MIKLRRNFLMLISLFSFGCLAEGGAPPEGSQPPRPPASDETSAYSVSLYGVESNEKIISLDPNGTNKVHPDWLKGSNLKLEINRPWGSAWFKWNNSSDQMKNEGPLWLFPPRKQSTRRN